MICQESSLFYLIAFHDSARIQKFDKDWNILEYVSLYYGSISLSVTFENFIFVSADDGIRKYDSQFNELDSYLNSSIGLSYVYFDKSKITFLYFQVN